MRDKFFLFLEEVSQKIQEFVNQNKTFLIIAAPTPDGISASSLLLHYFYYNNIQAHLIYLPEVSQQIVRELYNKYSESVYIFVDTGSMYFEWIKSFAGKPTFVIDHIFLPCKDKVVKNYIYNVNPWVFGIDGFREISTSGIVYYILKKIEHDFKDISYLSLVGAVGDLQENFTGINEQILNELIEDGVLERKKGLKLFGLISKPLYKALQLSMEVYVPEITESEENIITFLNRLKIPIKSKGGFITYFDLKENEQRKLISEIIKSRIKKNIPNAENILGDLYVIPSGFYFKELHEISDLLEATTRLNKISKAISYIFGDKTVLDDVGDTLIEYKTQLQSILKEIISNVDILKSNNLIIYDITDFTDTPYLISSIANFLSSYFAGNMNKILIVKYLEGNKTLLSIRSIPHKNLARIILSLSSKLPLSFLEADPMFGVTINNKDLENFYKLLKICARQESILI